MDLSKYKNKYSGKLEETRKALAKSGGGKTLEVKNQWTPKPDKKMVTRVKLRFMPVGMKDVEIAEKKNVVIKPIQDLISYSFNRAGKWYIEKSWSMHDQTDPVGDYNHRLWNEAEETGNKKLKDDVKKRSRRVSKYVNVYIYSDSTNPENNGKVRTFRMTKTAYEKIIDVAMNPKFDDQKAIDPFDLWDGGDVTIEIEFEEKKIGNNMYKVPTNYNCTWDMCEFMNGKDKKIEKVLKSLPSLYKIIDPETITPFDEQLEKFNKIMGFDTTGDVSDSVLESVSTTDDLDDGDEEPSEDKKKKKKNKKKKDKKKKKSKDDDKDINDIDDFLDSVLDD